LARAAEATVPAAGFGHEEFIWHLDDICVRRPSFLTSLSGTPKPQSEIHQLVTVLTATGIRLVSFASLLGGMARPAPDEHQHPTGHYVIIKGCR
jgi:hypothetical protein